MFSSTKKLNFVDSCKIPKSIPMNFFCKCSPKIQSGIHSVCHLRRVTVTINEGKQRNRFTLCHRQVSSAVNMGNDLCRYCTSPQPEWNGNTAFIHEQNTFTEEEKQRRLEEETQKQGERALVYEDILRKISEEKEVNITKASVAEERKKKEMEFDKKIQDEKYRLLAQDGFLSHADKFVEEEKDELKNYETPLKFTKEGSTAGSAIANSIPGFLTSSTEKSTSSLIPFPIERSAPTFDASPIANSVPSLIASPIANSVPNFIASPIANSAPSLVASSLAHSASSLVASSIAHSAPSLVASSIANSAPSIIASPIANSAPSMIASPIANSVPSFIASPIANSAPSLIVSPITIVSPTLARTDLEIERDVEKESVSTDRDDESIPAFLFDIVFNQSSSQSAGMKILPHKLSYKTAAGELKSNLLLPFKKCS